jgi:hypothetical protein
MSDEWITVALEEYRTLRQEALAAIEQMQRTLQIGLVAIGVLTAFAVDAVNQGAGVQVGLAIGTPVVAALVVALRLDELHRAVDAGAQVAVLEQKIGLRLGEGGRSRDRDPLMWESRVQEEFTSREDQIRHGVIAAILFAATAPAALLGLLKFAKHHDQWVLVASAIALVLAVTFAYQSYMLGKVRTRHEEALAEMDRLRPATGRSDTG